MSRLRGVSRTRSTDAVVSSGVHGEALEGLAKLIRGEVACEDWVAGLRSAERARQAA